MCSNFLSLITVAAIHNQVIPRLYPISVSEVFQEVCRVSPRCESPSYKYYLIMI